MNGGKPRKCPNCGARALRTETICHNCESSLDSVADSKSKEAPVEIGRGIHGNARGMYILSMVLAFMLLFMLILSFLSPWYTYVYDQKSDNVGFEVSQKQTINEDLYGYSVVTETGNEDASKFSHDWADGDIQVDNVNVTLEKRIELHDNARTYETGIIVLSVVLVGIAVGAPIAKIQRPRLIIIALAIAIIIFGASIHLAYMYMDGHPDAWSHDVDRDSISVDNSTVDGPWDSFDDGFSSNELSSKWGPSEGWYLVILSAPVSFISGLLMFAAARIDGVIAPRKKRKDEEEPAQDEQDRPLMPKRMIGKTPPEKTDPVSRAKPGTAPPERSDHRRMPSGPIYRRTPKKRRSEEPPETGETDAEHEESEPPPETPPAPVEDHPISDTEEVPKSKPDGKRSVDDDFMDGEEW